MGEKWIEAYAQWPPMHQMIFSLVCVIVALISLFLFGVWSLQFLAAWRMTKKEKEHPPGRPTPGIPFFGYPPDGFDWREEQRLLFEEQKFQANEQAKLQKEMEQAGALELPKPELEPDKKSPKKDAQKEPKADIPK